MLALQAANAARDVRKGWSDHIRKEVLPILEKMVKAAEAKKGSAAKELLLRGECSGVCPLLQSPHTPLPRFAAGPCGVRTLSVLCSNSSWTNTCACLLGCCRRDLQDHEW